MGVSSSREESDSFSNQIALVSSAERMVLIEGRPLEAASSELTSLSFPLPSRRRAILASRSIDGMLPDTSSEDKPRRRTASRDSRPPRLRRKKQYKVSRVEKAKKSSDAYRTYVDSLKKQRTVRRERSASGTGRPKPTN